MKACAWVGKGRAHIELDFSVCQGSKALWLLTSQDRKDKGKCDFWCAGRSTAHHLLPTLMLTVLSHSVELEPRSHFDRSELGRSPCACVISSIKGPLFFVLFPQLDMPRSSRSQQQPQPPSSEEVHTVRNRAISDYHHSYEQGERVLARALIDPFEHAVKLLEAFPLALTTIEGSLLEFERDPLSRWGFNYPNITNWVTLVQRIGKRLGRDTSDVAARTRELAIRLGRINGIDNKPVPQLDEEDEDEVEEEDEITEVAYGKTVRCY